MRHGFFWFLLAYVVIAAPIAVLCVVVWWKATSRSLRLGLLAAACVGFLFYSFYAMLWLPSFIFSWYESGRWPASPLGHRQHTIAIDQGVALDVRGREIRHAAVIERDWWWDLTYRPTSGVETPIGSTWSEADSLPLRVERSDSLLAVIVRNDPVAFVRTPSGRFRSYSFAYPFLNDKTYWRNLMWSMVLDLSDVERMHRDLEMGEQTAAPVTTIERFDLAARQILVRYRWPSRVRLATFIVDPANGHLALGDLVRRPVPSPE